MSEQLKSECINGVIYKYGCEWTKQLESKQHWEFYWHQQKLMEDFVEYGSGKELLEIGVGTGFTANYCRSKGLKVTTLDIDDGKNPDIVANAVSYDFPQKYDSLLAFEVFEHMPYSEFEKIVFKIPDFIIRYVFLSLPRNEKVAFSLNLKIPKFKPSFFEWRMPHGKISTEAHHWELDYKDYTTQRVEKLFTGAGFKIMKIMKCQYIKYYALKICK